MATDDRAQQAARLFHEAWRLAAELKELQGRLPAPQMPDRPGPLPPDWDELARYAQCVDQLRQGLEFALNQTMMGLGFRNEFHIQRELLPPERRT
jgi:hypothetical protein